MITRLFTTAALGALLSACSTVDNAPMQTAAPAMPTPASAAIPVATSIFAQPSTLPFQAPDFPAINDADYQAAIEEGIAIQLAEIAAIANNPAEPTFENTLVAMERTGQVFDRAYNVFGQKVGAHTNETLSTIDEATAPKIAAMYDTIYLDPALFARVKTVYDNRASMGMTAEDAMLLELTYAEFVHRGAELGAAQQAELRTINERLSQLSAQIAQLITDGQNEAAVTVDTRAELTGLGEGEIAAATAAATERGMPGKFVLVLTNTTSQPLLAQLDNRDLRERVFRASAGRNQTGEASTLELAQEAIALRTRIAELFETPDYATWQMYDRYLATPERAIGFMRDMVPALAASQLREAAVLNERIAQDGHNFTVQPWDWPYYAAKVRTEQYAFDLEAVKPYLEVNRVLEDGVFFMANKLYGLTFEKRTDLPVYHPDVSVYTVFDHDGSELALFYFDPFARDSKRGGAWMNNFVEQSHLLGLKPVIANTLNIAKPAEGQPALATWDDVNTMFHEFGHAVHGMFANQQYPSLSGTNTARDWVEFPSQFHEPFAALPEVIANYARHYQTGEPMPLSMVEAIERSSRFNQGYDFGEVISAALLDMQWHTLAPGEVPTDVMAFEAASLAEQGLHNELVPPRYRTPYYRHIFQHGYQAGYHAYTWTEMLAHDAYSWVEENGGMTRENGERIRATFLGQGHSKGYEEMFVDFTGRTPRVEPMLEAKGLLGE